MPSWGFSSFAVKSLVDFRCLSDTTVSLHVLSSVEWELCKAWNVISVAQPWKRQKREGKWEVWAMNKKRTIVACSNMWVTFKLRLFLVEKVQHLRRTIQQFHVYSLHWVISWELSYIFNSRDCFHFSIVYSFYKSIIQKDFTLRLW